jgi:hypothetical protein
MRRADTPENAARVLQSALHPSRIIPIASIAIIGPPGP